MKALRGFCAALALSLAGAALGQDACRNIEQKLAGEPLRMLQFLYFGECLGGDQDSAEVSKAVLQLLAANHPDEALRRVADYINAGARARNAGSQPLLASLSTEVDAVRGKLAARQPLGDQDVTGWQWRNTDFSGLPGISVARLDIKCPPAKDEECKEAAETGKIVFRAAHLVDQTLKHSLADVYEQALAAARMRKGKWDHYFDDARVQFPWELYANGLRYGADNRKAGGFAEPPNDQLIFMHPGVGMEYVGGAPSGSRFQAALVLELVGYNRWGWSKEGKMEMPFGASIIQTYSDRAGLASMRPGLMFHFLNKYSVAFTSRDGKTGILLSVDLAKLVTKVDEDERQAFKVLGR